MATALQARFGHEENFSRHLLESGQFAQLLGRAGFRPAGKGALEVPVRYGHKGREGRLDIHQPTTAGVVIGEMQYGTSDSNHRDRFDGYAKSVTNPAAIVWVAESFRDKDLSAVAMSKVPVLCVQAKETAKGEITLTVFGGARISAQSLEKRVAKAEAKAKQILPGLKLEERVLERIENIAQLFAKDGDVEHLESWLSLTAEEFVDDTIEYSIDNWKTGWLIGTSCFSEWKASFTLQVEVLWAGTRSRAEQLRAEVENQIALAEKARQKAEHEHFLWLGSLNNPVMKLRDERDRQDAIPAIKAAKLAAKEACRLWGEEALDANSVEELYRAAEALCLSYGFSWLVGLPCIGNFISERYRLMGAPREIADDLPGLFDMESLIG